MPSTVTATVLNFGTNAHTATSSEDEINKKHQEEDTTNSLLPKRKIISPISQQTGQTANSNVTDSNKMDTDDYQQPRKVKKFKRNFIKLLEQKAASTIPTKNRFHAISDTESDSESEPEVIKPIKGKATANILIKGASKLQNSKPNNKTKTKNKDSIPPIVIDGSTDNHRNLVNDLKGIIKGKYTIKYTNATTVTENEEDYTALLNSVKESEISHHTYTRADKTHAFVLRGMAKGTENETIAEDLRETYEIIIKEIFLMSTKFRPLYLIVTDPAITLYYLNKNVRIIENTRVTWKIRKAVKLFIQCHRCQAWGHATSNCGRPPRCLKCAGNHLTTTCIKTRDTPATSGHLRQLSRGPSCKLHQM